MAHTARFGTAEIQIGEIRKRAISMHLRSKLMQLSCESTYNLRGNYESSTVYVKMEAVYSSETILHGVISKKTTIGIFSVMKI